MKTTNKPLVSMLLAVIALLGTAVIYLAGCTGKSKQEGNGSENRAAAVSGDRISPYCADTACLNNGNASGLPGMISYATAKMMADGYGADESKGFIWDGQTNSKEEDARCIWFDLEKLKRFIAYVESAACRNNCPDSLRLGVRIYYAKYPGKDKMKAITELANVPQEYANHHTIFMVPTYLDWEKKTNIDFDPRGIGKGCRPYPIDPIKSTFWLGFDENMQPTDAQNHGSMNPPPAGTGIFPETGGTNQ